MLTFSTLVEFENGSLGVTNLSACVHFERVNNYRAREVYSYICFSSPRQREPVFSSKIWTIFTLRRQMHKR